MVDELTLSNGAERPAVPVVDERALQILFDAMPCGVWVAAHDGRCVYVNPAAAALLGREDILQHDDGGLAGLQDVAGHTVPAEDGPLARALRGEASDGVQLTVSRTDAGSDRSVRLIFAPLRQPNGAIVGAIVSASDRTPESQIERARDDFLASVAHDLRSPLTTIRGAAQLVLRRLQGPGQDVAALEKLLQTINSATGRLNRMLETLMDSARLARGGLSLQCTSTDIAALAAEVVAHHQQESQRHQVALIAPAAPLQGNWDPALLERAVENLVGNAVKYSPDGDTVRLTVRDQGIGIPATALPYIFDRFYRANSSPLHDIEGNGLGLFAVRGIVAAHGGRITAHSVEGEGTEMIVRLPKEPDECTK